ncbi:unnamed protein product [Cuscuta campestris]|uniref:Uncharacterized protein n=1 Tax=Cuscuta campestris TaxID=132261 RepID=A0A484LXP9_9ASTE|nr:unnamed protein product [Cuscuta campestris]
MKNVSNCQRGIGSGVVTLGGAAAASLFVAGVMLPLLSYFRSKQWNQMSTLFVVLRFFTFLLAMFLCGYGQALKSTVEGKCKIVRPGVLFSQGLLCFLLLALTIFLIKPLSKENKTSEEA